MLRAAASAPSVRPVPADARVPQAIGGPASVRIYSVQVPAHTDQGRVQIDPARLRGSATPCVSASSVSYAALKLLKLDRIQASNVIPAEAGIQPLPFSGPLLLPR